MNIMSVGIFNQWSLSILGPKSPELIFSSSSSDEEQPGPSRSNDTACPNCNNVLSCRSALNIHMERYCRYRAGKRAKPKMSRTAVVRQASAMNAADLNDAEFDSSSSRLWRRAVSVNGFLRDYLLESNSNEPVLDAMLWLTNEELLVQRLYDVMDDYVVKGRMVLRVWFVKRNPTTGEVLRRQLFYISSSKSSQIYNFHDWYHYHIQSMGRNLHSFNNLDSNLEFDGVEALDIQFSLTKNLSGQSYFKLPEKLRRMQAVINVDAPTACFKYALLSILHYDEISKHTTRFKLFQMGK